MTGFLRNGYCVVPEGDFGNHSVAAVVSDKFLDFSASRGNNLRRAGLTEGCKWCLCVSRWKEALIEFKRTGASDDLVPKVYLGATNEKALKQVSLDDLKQFSMDWEQK